MKYFTLITLLFNCSALLSQDLEKDTIQLNAALINHSAKKPKIKKLKFNSSNKLLNYDLYFNYDNVFYLIDSLPEGYIQEITLYFSPFSKQMKNNDWESKSLKSNVTEFEVTIYEVNDNYSVGNKVTATPIHITLEESKKISVFKTEKVKLDLCPYNFQVSRFFIGINKITETTCEDCYYYAPQLHKTGNKNYLVIEDEAGHKKQYSRNGLMLKSEIKTLTSNY